MESDNIKMVALAQAMEIFGEEKTQNLLSKYKAVKDSDTEKFLRVSAMPQEKHDSSRTYLAYAKDDLRIVGFVSLCIKSVYIPEKSSLSGSTIRKIDLDTETRMAQSYLLGQLSRSDDAPSGFGKDLMDFAFARLRDAKEIVGCRMVRLDCHDELVPYYTKHGFRPITENKPGTLNQMMALI